MMKDTYTVTFHDILSTYASSMACFIADASPQDDLDQQQLVLDLAQDLKGLTSPYPAERNRTLRDLAMGGNAMFLLPKLVMEDIEALKPDEFFIHVVSGSKTLLVLTQDEISW